MPEALDPGYWVDHNDGLLTIAKFCREDLHTFSTDLFGLKSRIPKLFRFLAVCNRAIQGYVAMQVTQPGVKLTQLN